MNDRPAQAPNRPLWIGLLLLSVAWVSFLAYMNPGAGRGGPLPPPGLLNQGHGQASYNWKLTDLEGRTIDFARFKGKTVFLNFWATWCPPCVGELPAIENLAANPRIQKAGIAVLAVSLGEDAKTVSRFVESRNMKALTFLRTDEPPTVFLTDAIPATFLIAPDGRIASKQVGSAQWDDPSVVEYLEALAKEQKVALNDAP